VRVLERCAILHERIQKRDAIRLSYRQTEVFRVRASEVRAAREEFDAAVARLRVLKARELLPRDVPSPERSAAIAQRCLTGLRADPTEIGNDYGHLKRSMEALTNNVLRAVDRRIDDVQRDLPSVDEAFLKQVETVPGFQAKVQSIRLRRQALLDGGDPRQSAEALARFLDTRKELRALADDLTPDEFPTEVLEFFRASRQGQGAPLEKFTGVVREWLAARGLTQYVRVTVVAR
jgi:hypothetical protein